jgi:hypothetical protein
MTDMTLFNQFRPQLLRGENAAYMKETVISDHGDWAVHYTPFEYENVAADFVLVGLTPGPEQHEQSYRTASALLSAGLSALDVLCETKRQGAFSGPIRPNVLKMLGHFSVGKRLGLKRPEDLWESGWPLFYPLSVLPNGVFHRTEFKLKAGRRRPQLFSGTFQEILSNPALNAEYETRFLPKISSIGKQARFIACGPEVGAALAEAVVRRAIEPGQILGSFVHPSTRAGTQVKVFVGEKTVESLKPLDPVRHRVARMQKDYSDLKRNLETWRPVP